MPLKNVSSAAAEKLNKHTCFVIGPFTVGFIVGKNVGGMIQLTILWRTKYGNIMHT